MYVWLQKTANLPFCKRLPIYLLYNSSVDTNSKFSTTGFSICSWEKDNQIFCSTFIEKKIEKMSITPLSSQNRKNEHNILYQLSSVSDASWRFHDLHLSKWICCWIIHQYLNIKFWSCGYSKQSKDNAKKWWWNFGSYLNGQIGYGLRTNSCNPNGEWWGRPCIGVSIYLIHVGFSGHLPKKCFSLHFYANLLPV